MNWLNRLLIGLVLIALISGGGRGVSPATAASSTTVELRPEVTVAEPPLTLSKLIEGQLPDGLEEIYLGDLPDPGRGKFVSRSYIMLCANEAGKPQPEFGGTQIHSHVLRPGQKLSESDLRGPVEELLNERLKANSSREVELVRLPDKVKVLPGDFELKLQQANPYQKLHTASNYTVEVWQQNSRTNTFKVQVEVRDYRQVAVANRSVKNGEKLTAEDFELRQKEINHFKGDLLTDTDSVIGYETTTQLSKGEVIRNRNLEKPLLVERNESVRLRYRVSGIVISTKGVAQGNGHKGDKIAVKNRSSKQQVHAEVIGTRKVMVKNGATGK